MKKLVIHLSPDVNGIKTLKHIIRIITRYNMCLGCRLCEYACPTSAIKIINKGNKYHISINKEKCISCLICNNLCPVGIYYEKSVLQSYPS